MKRQIEEYHFRDAESGYAHSLRQTVYAITISVLVLCLVAAVAYSGFVFRFFQDSPSYIGFITDETDPVIEPETEPPVTEPADTDPVTEPPVTEPPETEPPERDYTVSGRPVVVCVDPGHGYNDPGAQSTLLGGFDERDITLDLALRVEGYLKEAGYDVVMTRRDDVNPPAFAEYYLLSPQDRVNFAETQEYVDVYVSIHCNSLPTYPEIRGMELYYYPANTPLTADYAAVMADALAEAFDAQVKVEANELYEDAYYVTKAVSMPSILIETGYLSNEEDAALMHDETWKDAMAQAIANGVIAFSQSYLIS